MDSSDRWLAITLRVVLLGLFIWMIKGLLVPVALGALLALLLHPVQVRLEKRLGKRAKLSPLILTVGFFLLVGVPAIPIAAKVVSSLNEFLARDWSDTTSKIHGYVLDKTGSFRELFDLSGARIRESLESLVRRAGEVIAGLAGNLAAAVPGTIVDLFLFFVALYFLLRDGRKLTAWMTKMSPFPAHETEELFSSIQNTVSGAILGLFATSAVQGGLTILFLTIFRVPGAVLFGLLAMLLAFIPMVGTTPVTVGAVIYLLAVGRTGAGVGMAVAALVIGLSDNVIRPWVQSRHSTNIHPLIVLLAIFGGLELFGAAGVFVGPVIAAMAVWTVDTYAHIRVRHSKRGTSLPPPAGTPTSSLHPPPTSG
jgi:predicted PurR-regulated permease PerM